MTSLRAPVTMAVLTLGLLAAGWWAWNNQNSWLARRWARQLEQAPDDQLDDLLDRIVRLGEPGMAALVDALASGRQELAERAALVITDEIARWKTLPAKTADQRLTALALALAGRIERFDPQTSQHAAVIARHILAWPGDDASGGGEAIASCEAVLRMASARAVQGESRESRVKDLALSSRLSTLDTAVQRDPPAGVFSPGPEGGVSLETPPLPDAAPQDPAQGGRAAEKGGQPRPKGSGFRVQSSGFGGDGWASPIAPIPEPRTLNPEPVRRLAAGESLAAGDRAAAAQAAREEILAAIRGLQAPDPAQAAAAEAELRRHGFGDREIALARQVLNPDPQTRRRLARLLPEVPGLDAVPWLVLLSRDADAEVRLTALTLLATTGDPAILDQVGELVRADADPRVQRLAERLAPGPK